MNQYNLASVQIALIFQYVRILNRGFYLKYIYLFIYNILANPVNFVPPFFVIVLIFIQTLYQYKTQRK